MKRNMEQKERAIKGLKQITANVQEIKDFINSLEGSEEARRNLFMAEFSLIEAIHQIKLIKEDVKVESESSENEIL